jgi:hypothetical protein
MCCYGISVSLFFLGFFFYFLFFLFLRIVHIAWFFLVPWKYRCWRRREMLDGRGNCLLIVLKILKLRPLQVWYGCVEVCEALRVWDTAAYAR